MSDPGPAVTGVRELAAVLAAAALEVPGVVRLEPTLQNSLQRIARVAARPLPSSAAGGSATVEGLTVSLRAGTANVAVEIAVRPTPAAAVTARAVQARLTERLRRHGHEPGSITVTVLAVEPG